MFNFFLFFFFLCRYIRNATTLVRYCARGPDVLKAYLLYSLFSKKERIFLIKKDCAPMKIVIRAQSLICLNYVILSVSLPAIHL